MKVKVKFFAMCREIAGADEIFLELPASATLTQFWDAMLASYPDLEKFKTHSRLALNMEYAAVSAKLKDGDEVCIIPPVSGG